MDIFNRKMIQGQAPMKAPAAKSRFFRPAGGKHGAKLS